MDYITLRDPADYTEIDPSDYLEPEPPPMSDRERRLHELRHELKYWRDDLLLSERAINDPDHAAIHAELPARMAQARLEVERLEFEIKVAELKGEVKVNEATIELHEDGLRACNKRIIHLLNTLDDVKSEREYRLSDECKAGLTYSEWNRIQLGLDARKAVTV